MTETAFTRHAIARMGQRGIRDDDLELIRLIGTPVENGYLVRERDFQTFELALKRLADDARRQIGKRVVEVDGTVVTAYHASRGKERRLVRRCAERDLIV
jgi:RNA-binding protein YhbY